VAGGGLVAATLESCCALTLALSPDFEPDEEDSPLPADCGPPDLAEARLAERVLSPVALALPAAEELLLPDEVEVEVGPEGGETTGAG